MSRAWKVLIVAVGMVGCATDQPSVTGPSGSPAGPVAAFVGATATSSVDFEGPLYSTGSPNGQDGWVFTSGTYDVAVVANTYGYSSFGSQSLRVSNAVTSASFGDWAFSKAVTNEAGEATAQNGGLSGGTRQDFFEASFDLASAVPASEQAGLQFSVAADRGDGARMTFLRFNDTPGGVDVTFADYQLGTGFVLTVVASGLDRSVPHNIRQTILFIAGPANDVVKIYVDGTLVHTGTTWEDYFRKEEGNPTRTVDGLLLQARSNAGTAPSTLGQGFLVDNLEISTGPAPSAELPVVNSTTVKVWTPALNGWVGVKEVGFGCSATPALVAPVFEAGPAPVPLGLGSAKLEIPTGDCFGPALILPAYSGVKATAIRRMQYSTYRQSVDPGNNLAVSLQFEADFDRTDNSLNAAASGFMGRIVFEPYLAAPPVTQNAWQTWDATTGASTGYWWTSRSTVVVGGASVASQCPQANPCTWEELLLRYPNLEIRGGGNGKVILKAGGGWTAGFVGNVDALVISVDQGGLWEEKVFDFDVDTEAPVVSNVAVAPNPAPYTTASFTLTATGTDNAAVTSAAYTIDGGSPVAFTFSAGSPVSLSASIGPMAVGVYDICVTAEDAASNVSNTECTMLAVYDPDAGFVTGGGWFSSPAGAYRDNLSLTGKASFGFVSKYVKGKTLPTGSTEFQFQAGGLSFSSTAYEWLVVNQAGMNAQFKGVGALNGSTGYKFMVWAKDGAPDTFRIQITDSGGTVVYDNSDEEFGTPLAGGNIMIHIPKK